VETPLFKDVFSITGKVLLALFIISVLVGIGTLIIGGVGARMSPAKSPIMDEFTKKSRAEQDKADARRTTMPKSRWDRGVARAIKHHCVTNSMTEEDVLRAFGEPGEKTDLGIYGSDWTWPLPPGKCLKYDGENCIEREKNNAMVGFSTKGNVQATDGCHNINGDFVYLSTNELFF